MFPLMQPKIKLDSAAALAAAGYCAVNGHPGWAVTFIIIALILH